jgi:periplasmic protein TonB
LPMEKESSSFFSKLKDSLERLFALKVTEQERIRYSTYGIFDDGSSGRRPLQVATVLAALVHILFFMIVFPSWNRVFEPTEQVLVLKRLAPPAAVMGGGDMPEAAPPKPIETLPEPKPIMVPIPDPTPHEPEPIRKREIEETPQIVAEIATDLNIGDITAPPGPPARGGQGAASTVGTGSGPVAGAGPGTGGDGVYPMGGDVSDPIVLVQTKPTYTDEAIKAKVQGVVLLQAIIRRNGQVDQFRVLRGLGYGLEEKAIQEIASNWKFRPGTRNGVPVDVLATIEVTFNLR